MWPPQGSQEGLVPGLQQGSGSCPMSLPGKVSRPGAGLGEAAGSFLFQGCHIRSLHEPCQSLRAGSGSKLLGLPLGVLGRAHARWAPRRRAGEVREVCPFPTQRVSDASVLTSSWGWADAVSVFRCCKRAWKMPALSFSLLPPQRLLIGDRTTRLFLK